MNDDQAYRHYEISKVLITGDDLSSYTIKISNDNESTKYLNISRAELLEILKILTGGHDSL